MHGRKGRVWIRSLDPAGRESSRFFRKAAHGRHRHRCLRRRRHVRVGQRSVRYRRPPSRPGPDRVAVGPLPTSSPGKLASRYGFVLARGPGAVATAAAATTTTTAAAAVTAAEFGSASGSSVPRGDPGAIRVHLSFCSKESEAAESSAR